MANEQEIFEQVREVLVDALAEDEVEMDSTLVDDLGAESIDLLDIVFQLEKKFDIKIDRGELIPTEKLDDPKYVQDGKLTADGLAMLQEALPSANLETFLQNPVIQNLAKILSVKDLVHLVKSKLA
jgi:acyl carrier protein